MADAHAIHQTLSDATIEEVTLLGMSGATAQFIDALRGAAAHDLTAAANIVALRSVGINQSFVD